MAKKIAANLIGFDLFDHIIPTLTMDQFWPALDNLSDFNFKISEDYVSFPSNQQLMLP